MEISRMPPIRDESERLARWRTMGHTLLRAQQEMSEADPLDEAAIEALVNLMHFMRHAEMSFDNALEMARGHYAEEIVDFA